MQTLDHHHSPHQQHSLSESDDQYSSSLVLSYNDENEHDVDKSNSEGDQDDVSDLSSIVAPIQPVNRSSWTIEDMRNLLSSNRRHSQDGGSIKLLQSLKPNTTPGLRSIFQTVFDNKFGTIGVNNNNNNKIARSSSVATILNPCLNEKHEDSLIFAGPIISISEYMAKSGLGKLLSRKSKKIGINTRKSLVLLEISTACIREYELVKNGKKGDLLCEIQTQFMGFGLKRKRGNASTINNNNNNCNSLNLDNNINHTATTSPTSSNHLFSRSRPNSTGSSSLATCTEERRHSSGNEYASTDKQKLMFVLKDNSSDAGVERIYEGEQEDRTRERRTETQRY